MHTWLRSTLIGCGLLFFTTMALLAFLLGTTTGLQALSAMAVHFGKGTISIGKASGTLLSPLHLQDLRYSDGNSTYEFKSLELHWMPTRLFQRELRIRRLAATGVRIDPGQSAASEKSGEPPTLSDISLPGKVLVEEVDIQPLTLVADKESPTEIRRIALKQCSFSGSAFQIDELLVAFLDNLLTLGGQLQTTGNYPMQWRVALQAHPPEYQPLDLHAAISGSPAELTIDANLTAPVATRLKATVRDTLSAAKWDLLLTSPTVALQAINKNWPDQQLADLRISGKGDLENYALSIQVSTEKIRDIEGLTSLKSELKGNLDGIRLEQLTFNNGPTQLAVKGDLHWQPNLRWQAEVDGAHVDPGLLAADWPGNLSCTLRTSGEMTDKGVKASVLMPQLQGQLRKYPVQGQAEIHIDGKQLRIPKLALKSGTTSLQAQGAMADKIDLSLAMQAPDLRTLHTKARGKLDLRATLAGTAKAPQLHLDLEGSDLALQDARIKQITLGAKGELSQKGTIQAKLALGQVRQGAYKLDSLQMLVDGRLASHTLSLTGSGPDLNGALVLKGRVADETWHGMLQETELTAPLVGSWKQAKPAALTVSAHQAKLAPFSLLSGEDAELRVSGDWEKASGTWQAHAALKAFPLLRLNPELEERPWTLDGRINTTLDASGKAGRIAQAKALLETVNTRLRVHAEGYDKQEFTWKTNTIRANYAGSALRINLESVLADESHIRGNLGMRVADLQTADFLRIPMRGDLNIQIKDLSPIFALSNHTVKLSGSIQGRCAIAGSPAQPELTGDIGLVDGKAEIPALGIAMESLQLSIAGNADTLQLQADAHSGSGSLNATGTLHLNATDGQENLLRITGSGFKAMQTPGIDLDISPDLTIGFDKQRIDVTGALTIPHAKITSIDTSKATPHSTDVVVVDDDDTASPSSPIPLRAEVNVIAGDDVLIDAYGLRAGITGNLNVAVQPGRPQTGRGTLNIKNGSFTMYSKRLAIDMGRLIFSGGPLDNPGIELRSERKKGRTTTGVVITGTLQRPEISFYSSPTMEQATIMASLLEDTAFGGETREDLGTFGMALDKVGLGKLIPYFRSLKKFSMIDEIKLETGDNYEDLSLVFGSWVTPDLYVSYGQDMTKESATFNTKFRLGKGFYLLTETGAEQSGGDVQYEFEH
ncbi:MAG: translocation/assembly module TamB domain-containing protein [Desulfobulbus sp.]|jgi:translocation and assembly module TamB